VSSDRTYQQDPDSRRLVVNEQSIEDAFIAKLSALKYPQLFPSPEEVKA
jgi:hypothetical protein